MPIKNAGDRGSPDSSVTDAPNFPADLANMARLASLDEIVTDMTHELNQPLAAIANYVAAIQASLEAGSTEDAGKRSSWLDEIADEAFRGGRIIRRLRDFVRKREPHRSRVQVNQLVREAADFVGDETRRQEVSFRFDLAKNVPVTLADPIQIQQVLVNLTHNATEAMSEVKPNSREVAVATALAEDNQIQVSVADQGGGLPPDMESRAFDAFVTDKPQSLGLVLAICRSIVQWHGGRLWATANEGQGMTFRFTLPITTK